MKSILAFTVVALALSLCNLTGKRTNNNENTRPSGTSSEASASPSPEDNSAPVRKEVGSGMPPSVRDERIGAPTKGASNPGPAMIEPPPPPKPKATPPPVISGGVLNGKATSLPKPTYPPIARAAHASGAVNVQVLVDENGNVISAVAVSGHPLLKASAQSAARQAKFAPMKLSGQPVKVSGIIVYNFIAQ